MTIFNTLNNRGVFETIWILFDVIFVKISSLIKIFFLRLRLYMVDYSVQLRGKVYFFQLYKKSITVKKNVSIGRFTEIATRGKGKIHIEENVIINDNCCLYSADELSIGARTMIASFCFITDISHNFDKRIPISRQGYNARKVVIGNDVWLGTGVRVLQGVTIGEGSIIGAGAVVTKDIPAFSVAVGIPAKVIAVRKK